MQSCFLPSSLYSIIRQCQHTETVHNGYSMTRQRCQLRQKTKQKKLWFCISYTKFSGTTKSGSLASRSATTHLTISPVNRNVFSLRHKRCFVSWILLKSSLKVSEKQNSSSKQNRFPAIIYLVPLNVVSCHVIYCQNRPAAAAAALLPHAKC